MEERRERRWGGASVAEGSERLGRGGAARGGFGGLKSGLGGAGREMVMAMNGAVGLPKRSLPNGENWQNQKSEKRRRV